MHRVQPTVSSIYLRRTVQYKNYVERQNYNKIQFNIITLSLIVEQVSYFNFLRCDVTFIWTIKHFSGKECVKIKMTVKHVQKDTKLILYEVMTLPSHLHRYQPPFKGNKNVRKINAMEVTF